MYFVGEHHQIRLGYPDYVLRLGLEAAPAAAYGREIAGPREPVWLSS